MLLAYIQPSGSVYINLLKEDIVTLPIIEKE